MNTMEDLIPRPWTHSGAVCLFSTDTYLQHKEGTWKCTVTIEKKKERERERERVNKNKNTDTNLKSITKEVHFLPEKKKHNRKKSLITSLVTLIPQQLPP